jgi:predicted secreted protein
MKWTSALAIYALFWSFCLFLVLPFGVRTHEEAGAERVPGQADSAPHGYDPWRIARRTTIVSAAAFALYYLNYVYGWLPPEAVDFFTPGP